MKQRRIWPAIWSGFRGRCPECGQGRLFASYLKTTAHCGACNEAMHHHRADDAPPYFTIVIVGHIVVPMILLLERQYHPPYWLHMALWLPLTLILSLWLLPKIKGALVAWQWAIRMHGFDENQSEQIL